MSIVVSTRIDKCSKCPYYIPEYIDKSHGCEHTPPFCDRQKRTIKLEGTDNFPPWCPFLLSWAKNERTKNTRS